MISDSTRIERNREILGLLQTLDAHSPGERGHAERVAVYSVATGERLGLPDDDLLNLRYAATLHDFGKVRVDATLLRKLGKLDEDELRAMRLHAMLAEAALHTHEWLVPALPLIRHHHERWDGTGYPDGLAGSDIPLGARIINLAETFDVLTMREGDPVLIEDLAIAELEHCAGGQFDPEVVAAFVQIQPLILPIQTS